MNELHLLTGSVERAALAELRAAAAEHVREGLGLRAQSLDGALALRRA